MPLNPNATDKRIIGDWLTKMVDLTSENPNDPMGEEKFADYVEMLAMDFPTAAFTKSSMHAVLSAPFCKSGWFPKYPPMRAEIAEWWNANKPAIAPRLDGPKDDDLSREDQRALDSFRKRHDAPQDEKNTNAPRGQALSFMHDRFYGAWKELMRHADNREAYQKYVGRAWNWRAIEVADATETKRRFEAGQPIRKVSDVLPKYQPSAKVEDVPKPMPAHLSPEQLAQAYGVNGHDPRANVVKPEPPIIDAVAEPDDGPWWEREQHDQQGDRRAAG